MYKVNLTIVLLLISITITSGTFILDTKSSYSNINNSNNTIITASENNSADEDSTKACTETEEKNTSPNNLISSSKINSVNNKRGIPVLYYHSVNNEVFNEVTISPDTLKKELKYIKDNGYTTLSLDEVNQYILNKKTLPEKSILITFDDGYMDNYYYAFPILKELNMKATIFCITSKLDGSYYLSENAIKEMSQNNIDIESHTVNHKHLNELNYKEQLEEMKNSKAKLESIIEKEVNAIAFPFGDYNNDSVLAAKEAGYNIAFTTNNGLITTDANPLELNRIYISSFYDMDTFKSILEKESFQK